MVCVQLSSAGHSGRNTKSASTASEAVRARYLAVGGVRAGTRGLGHTVRHTGIHVRGTGVQDKGYEGEASRRIQEHTETGYR